MYVVDKSVILACRTFAVEASDPGPLSYP